LFEGIDQPLTSVAASYTMLVRIRFLAPLCFLVALLASACGGGATGMTPGGAVTGAGAACTPGATSVMGAMNDPCAGGAVANSCAFSQGMTVSTCGPDNKWGECICMPMPGSVTMAVNMPRCGDGILQQDLGEQCEQGMTTECFALLGKGATGLVNCTKDCKYDMTLCVAPGSGAGGTGSGTGGTGATATAGTGR
jgi:hypothetical protein